MSLVAEYDSSSESDTGSNKGAAGSEKNGDAQTKIEVSDIAENQVKINGNEEENKIMHQSSNKLPSASSVMERKTPQQVSVWANEYKKDEEEKTKALEQHVKMVENTKSIPINGKVNGKKVCWMYNRGRCRLGRKCQMYHDSELRTPEGNLKNIQEKTERSAPITKPQITPNKRDLQDDSGDGNEENDGPKRKVPKKKFGLGDDIVPSKKVIQHYETVAGNEAKVGQ